jgi:Ca2+-binding EF-hand superfamily protein
MSDEVKVKLNKEALEAQFAQMEYLKGLKKDAMGELIKSLEGRLTEDDVEEMEKLFRSLDTDETNEMPITQLGTCMRILRQLPTENEINQLAEEINPEKKEKISFYQFLKAMSKSMRDPEEIAEEIKLAFKVLDKHKQGYIMSADLRDFLSKQGDCLIDEEIDEMIKIGDTESNGQIHYEQFVHTMLTMQTEKKKKKKGKKGKKKK